MLGHPAPRAHDNGLPVFHRSQVSKPGGDIRQAIISVSKDTRRRPTSRLRYDNAAPGKSGQAIHEGTARQPGNTPHSGGSNEPTLVSPPEFVAICSSITSTRPSTTPFANQVRHASEVDDPAYISRSGCMQYCSPVKSTWIAPSSLNGCSSKLEAKIVDRSYPTWLPPRGRCRRDELGVSRTPVREAFRLLQRAGWLDLRPHAGAYVRYPTVDEVRMSSNSAKRWSSVLPNLPPVGRRHQSTAAGQARRPGHRALERGDMKAVGNETTPSSMRRSPSRLTTRCCARSSDLAKHVRWHFSAVAGIRGEASWTEHETILAAIVRGEEARAATLAAEHSQHTQNTFFAHSWKTAPRA